MRTVTVAVLVAVLTMAPLAVNADSKETPATPPADCHKAKAGDSTSSGCGSKTACDKDADKASGCKAGKNAAGKCEKAGKCDKQAAAGECEKKADKCGKKAGSASGCSSAAK